MHLRSNLLVNLNAMTKLFTTTLLSGLLFFLSTRLVAQIQPTPSIPDSIAELAGSIYDQLALTLLQEDTVGKSFAIHRKPGELAEMPAAMKAKVVVAAEQRLQRTECSLKQYPGGYFGSYLRLEISTQIEDTTNLSRIQSWKLLSDNEVKIDEAKLTSEDRFKFRHSPASRWQPDLGPVTESILFERYYKDTLAYPVRTAEVVVSMHKGWYTSQHVLDASRIGDTIAIGGGTLRLTRMTQDYATLDVLTSLSSALGYVTMDKNLRESARTVDYYGAPIKKHRSFYDVLPKSLIDLFYDNREITRAGYIKIAAPAVSRALAIKDQNSLAFTLIFDAAGVMDILHLFMRGEVYQNKRTIRCIVEREATPPKSKNTPRFPRLEDLHRIDK